PYNVTISAGADANQSGFTATGNDSVINVTTLTSQLALSNVTVSTGSGGSQAGNIPVATALLMAMPPAAFSVRTLAELQFSAVATVMLPAC
ncbi:hypothetical protein, partial [Acinetobacter baumannii]|uniref:hypothetical protein n=1 Tax=Acinetobacter baumannii TaxID=470 RepID=UPI0013CF86C3